ncbi:MAG: hypothetical protein EA401_08955 [Planctomycetota bacterium]|nr:MAG: hypothetical protein EA401_08955 [Planctomycetota bacterium]
MRVHLLSSALLFCCIVSSAAAVETRLRLGPSELGGDAGIISKYVDEGATRIDAATGFVSGTARWWNIGLSVDAFIALDDSNRSNIDAGETAEIAARIDYLYEIPEMLQIIPYFETSFYPAHSSGDEPYYLGVDVWYLLPWEGFEVGGGLAYDLDDDAGLRGALAARQFIQPDYVDLAFYQALRFGSRGYREHLIGLRRNGLTVFELGASAGIPLPLEDSYLSIFAEGHYWLESRSRDAVHRSAALITGLSFTYYTRSPGW